MIALFEAQVKQIHEESDYLEATTITLMNFWPDLQLYSQVYL